MDQLIYEYLKKICADKVNSEKQSDFDEMLTTVSEALAKEFGKMSDGGKDSCKNNYKEEKEPEICKLETNIDDCSGEVLGYVMDLLFEAGARDVHYMPVFMKKNRPGWQLNVICDESKREALEEIIFRETTTIGIRRIKFERSILSREIKTVDTPYGEALVKVCGTDKFSKCYPEYETIAKLAKAQGVSFNTVFQAAIQAYNEKLED